MESMELVMLDQLVDRLVVVVLRHLLVDLVLLVQLWMWLVVEEDHGSYCLVNPAETSERETILKSNSCE